MNRRLVAIALALLAPFGLAACNRGGYQYDHRGHIVQAPAAQPVDPTCVYQPGGC